MSSGVKEDLHRYWITERPHQVSRWTQATDHQAFMLNHRGTRMQGNSYWKVFKSLLRRAELPPHYSLHHLRHSIATHLLGGGLSLERVRDFLGHQCLESTQIYTHLSAAQLQPTPLQAHHHDISLQIHAS